MNEAPWKLPWIGLVYLLVALLVILPTAATDTTTADATSTPTTTTTKNSDATNQIIEQSLLRMFGFKKRPRLKEGTVVPEHLLKLYEEKSKDASESTDFSHNRRLLTGSANTVRSFYHSESDDDQTEDPNTIRLRFNLDDMPIDEQLSGAELRLYKEWLIDADQSVYRVDIHDVVKAGRTADDTISHLIDTKILDTRRTDAWESFDISATVLRWLKSKRSHNEIEVRFLSRDGRKTDNQHVRLRRSVPEEGKKRKKRKRKKKKKDEVWDRNRPHLVTYSDDSKAQTKSERKEERKRRRMERRRRRRKWKDQCRRHKLYVDFSDVGWNDWIVAPPGYHAYYCHGECPMPLADHLNSTNHAIVQNLVNSAYPDAVPKACCVPTELSPISMLYADETGAVVLKTYQEMVVQGCGCR